MSLVIPLVFFIVFLILLYIFNDPISLLLYAIFLTYVFLDYEVFFTDTMSASILGNMQLLTGTIAASSYAKMIYVAAKRRASLLGV